MSDHDDPDLDRDRAGTDTDTDSATLGVGTAVGPTDAEYQAARPVSPLSYVFFAGVAVVAVGLIWWGVERDSSAAVVLWLFAGLVGVLAPVAWHLVDIGAALTSRRGVAFVFVLITLALGLVGIVAASAVNVVLHERGSLPVADMTSTGDYSLSDETRTLFEGLGGTVYFTYFEGPATPPGVRMRAQDQLYLYAHTFPNCRFRIVDRVLNPSAASRAMTEWGIERAPESENRDVLVVTFAAEGREIERGRTKEVVVDQQEWLEASPLGDTLWVGQRLISSAVQELVFQRLTAYATGGHGEESFGGNVRKLRDRIRSHNVELNESALSLSQGGGVPSNCDAVFVLDPQTSFSPAEEDALRTWLDTSGGTLFLTLDPRQEDQPIGLERLLGEYGLAPQLRYEIQAPRIDRTMQSAQMMLLGFSPVFWTGSQQYTDHPAVRALRRHQGQATSWTGATYVNVSDRPSANGARARAAVMAFSVPREPGSPVDPRAWALRLEPGRTEAPAPGARDVTGIEFPIVATSERQGTSGKPARIVVVCDADAIRDEQVLAGRLPNLDLALGLFQWGTDREGLVSVSSATLRDVSVRMTPRLHRFAIFWPLGTALIPLLLGAAVWWFRRR